VSARVGLVVLILGWLPAHGFQVEQLTCAPASCRIGHAQLTGDGQRIVFRSTCDLVPDANPDGNHQVFVREVESGRLTQLTPADPTRGLGPGYPPSSCSFSGRGLATDHSGSRVVMVPYCEGRARGDRWRLLDHREGQGLRAGPWVPCGLGVLPGGLSSDGEQLVVDGDCHPLRGRRRTFRVRLYLQDAPRRGFKRLGPAGCESFWGAVNAGGLLVFNSNCRRFVGPNPRRIVQLVALDRITGSVRQLTMVPGSGCGGFSLLLDGFIVPPAVSAAGHIAVGASCTDAAGPVLPEQPNQVLFLAGPGGALEQATSDYCVTNPAGNDGSLGNSAIALPVSLSADGSAVAFSMLCGIIGRLERRLFVVRPAGTPRVLEVSLTDAARFTTPPSMDGAGRALVVSSEAPLGGCPTNGTRQLYLARDLDDPTPRPTVCACPPVM